MTTEESEKPIKKLINLERLLQCGSTAALALYMPLGLVLGLIRCFIFLHFCILFYLLPEALPIKRWILRIMLTVTGVMVINQGKARLQDKRMIIISNHISSLDPFILTLLHSSHLAVESPSLLLLDCVPSTQIELPADKDHSGVIRFLKDKLRDNKEPVLFFPEKVKTNGTSGVLKFSLVPFEADHPIQPVAIQANRIFSNVNISTVSSSAFQDLIWCFFLPLTIFKIKYLPVTERKKDEEVYEFASRVQVNLARSLNIDALPYSYNEISLYLKEKNELQAHCQETVQKERQAPEPKNLSDNIETSNSSDLQRMIHQVREVLPDTPFACIEADLRNTQDVDTTITNILEGKVDTSSVGCSELGQKSLFENQSFKASKFGHTAEARQLSFAERKQAMLEAARLKYRIKHGL